MERAELEQLTKAELVELVLRLQRPGKSSRTSSKPPSSDPKEKRENARPGGARSGHEGHARTPAETPDAIEDHHPRHCRHCGQPFEEGAQASVIGQCDEIDPLSVKPVVKRHRRMSCQCSRCGKVTNAPVPAAAQGTPFGRQIHAPAICLKTRHLFSCQRLQGVFADLFGLRVSQGALMNMFKRTAPAFAVRRDEALALLRRAEVVASDETGVRIEGCNAYHRVFCPDEAVVHGAWSSRSAQVVRDTMDGHRPQVRVSDRYTARQGHGERHQTCLAHLDRKARFVAENGSDMIGMRLQFRFDRAFRLAGDIATLAASTVKHHRRALKRDPDAILASVTLCPLAVELPGQIHRARDQLLTFCDFPGKVNATNNLSERALRPSLIQRKVTNGYRSKWAADGEAYVRTVLDTARLAGAAPFHTIADTISL